VTDEEIAAWEPFLKRVALFSGLSSDDLRRIGSRLQALSLPRGSTLFNQGDESDALYIVTSGQIRVVQNARGVETVTAFLSRGDMLGEAGILANEPRTATARLATTCEVLKLPRKDFEELLRQTPSILLHLSRMLTMRLVETSRPAPRFGHKSAELIAVNLALPRPDRLLVTLHLALELMEQTRRRVLLVDLNPEPGGVARALGLKPVLVTEEKIRELNLREPVRLRTLCQQHPSGLELLNVTPATLGGRLYGNIYLFLNYLRDMYDLVVVALHTELGDVERAALAESDQVVLAGADANRPQFRQLEAELRGLVEPKKIVPLWFGEPDLEDTTFTLAPGAQILPWLDDIADQFDRTGSPYEPLRSHPKSQQAISRLARRLGGVKVGLALGTGAALGFSLIGVLKVFKKEHIPIDIIAGTSIGSVMAGFTALGMEPEEIEEIALRIDKGWVYENLFWDMTLPRSGLFAGQTLLRFLRSYFGSREFNDLEIPFACVATDIETGEEVVLREGRVAESIRASCGLPLIFSPMRLNGRYLVDGGLVNPVPTSVLAGLGADTLIAVNLTAPASERQAQINGRARRAGQTLLSVPVDLETLKDLTLPNILKAPNLVEVFFQMIYTMEYEIAQARVGLAHVLIQPNLKGFSWTEMHRAKELIRAGELIGEQYVAQVKSLIPYFADYCTVPIRLSSPL
jgi:NTE family protein